MLFIKFTIGDMEKYQDFRKVYEHMIMTREPGFEFEEEEALHSDWDSTSNSEVYEDISTSLLATKHPEEERRWFALIPDYAQKYLASYLGYDMSRAGALSFSMLGILNYLEFSMEVEMNNLQIIKNLTGLVEFSALAYPYGGMERFLMVMKAFDLIPIECFNGFTVYEFDWVSEFTHEAIDLPEATRRYKQDRDYLFL